MLLPCLLTLVSFGVVGAPDLELPSSLRVDPRPAAKAKLLPIDAAPLADARAELSRGRAAAALERLKGVRDGPLADRAALVAGDALTALSQPEAALDAYGMAVDRAQTTGVRVTAARGVVEALDLLERPKARLAWIEALRSVEPASVDLRLAHAEVLTELGEHGAADGLLRSVIVDRPTSAHAEAALMIRRRIPPPLRGELRTNDLIRKLENELAAGEPAAAMRTLELVTGLEPRRARLLRWKWARGAGHRSQELELIDTLLEDDPDGRGADALWLRRGRLALNADRTDDAVAAFDEAVRRFPRTREAVEAAFLAGWSRYDEGAYDDAERRMRAFVERFPRSRKVTEAWWYAGWAAYLDGRDDDARAAWTALVERHPRSDLVPFAHYWMGRSFERDIDANPPSKIESKGRSAGTDPSDDAIRAYRRASAASPLSYYAFWARARLEALGEPVERPSPPDGPDAFDLRQILVELGPRRPISVDRAVALEAAGLDDDVDDEVRTMLRALPRATSTRQAVLRVDLLHRLGAHARAFRYAYGHRPPSAHVMDGDYWAWRAHRQVYPKAYGTSVREVAGRHEVDALLVWSIMRSESHYRQDALSPVGARGLMQVMPATARRIGRVVRAARPHSARLLEPHSNVWLGSWYLGQLDARYHGYLPAQIGAYNAGPTAMDRWLGELDGRPTDEFIERISYRETRRYVRRVLETLWAYELLYGRPRTPLGSKAQKKDAPEETVAF